MSADPTRSGEKCPKSHKRVDGSSARRNRRKTPIEQTKRILKPLYPFNGYSLPFSHCAPSYAITGRLSEFAQFRALYPPIVEFLCRPGLFSQVNSVFSASEKSRYEHGTREPEGARGAEKFLRRRKFSAMNTGRVNPGNFFRGKSSSAARRVFPAARRTRYEHAWKSFNACGTMYAMRRIRAAARWR